MQEKTIFKLLISFPFILTIIFFSVMVYLTKSLDWYWQVPALIVIMFCWSEPLFRGTSAANRFIKPDDGEATVDEFYAAIQPDDETNEMYVNTSRLVNDQKIFDDLKINKDASGLLLFLANRPHWFQRVQRAIVEVGSVNDINKLISDFNDVDFKLLIEQIIFFRKSDKQFLLEAANDLLDLEPWEREIIIGATFYE